MNTKTCVWIGFFIGSTAGSWLGALLGGGNWLGWQSILGGAIGGLLGIYAGYKAGQYI